MVRKLFATGAILGLLVASVGADHHMMGEDGAPPMHPGVVLGPPEGFEPPEDMPPPPMSEDMEENKRAMLEMFFQFMDADGSGAIDPDEFHAWVRDFHMPPPPDGMGEGPMGGDPMGDMGDGMMEGMLVAGEGDLADLDIAPNCSDDLRDSEQSPQAEGVPCGDREGNLIFRTICNMPGYNNAAISLPDGRAAGCFGLEALRGGISFEIVSEDGGHIWDTTMGKESFQSLKLDGPGVFHVKSTGGSPDGAVTVRFVDVDAGM